MANQNQRPLLAILAFLSFILSFQSIVVTAAPATTPSLPPIPTPAPPPPTLYFSDLPPPSHTHSSWAKSSGAMPGFIIVGLVIALAILGVLYSYYSISVSKKLQSRRNGRAGVPLPHGPEDDLHGGLPQYNQHNAPSTTDHVLRVMPNPSPSPLMSSSGGPHDGSVNPLPSLSLDMHLRLPRTFTYDELATATNGFSNENLLGKGGFGNVYKGVLPSGKEVAVKQQKVGGGQGHSEFQAEVEIISQVHHRHLVSLVGYYNAEAERMLVYDLVPNNTLHFHLHESGRPTLEWPNRLKIAIGSAKGLTYLHEDCNPKIIHRDIKATNILLDSNFEAKVADFGLAKFITDSKTHISTQVRGTFGYVDPDYHRSGKLTFKSDVFAFGVVLLELITGRPARYSDLGLVHWARPLLTQYLVEGKFDTLVDARLQSEYNKEEMASMVVCAIHCLSPSAQDRIRMIEALRILEGGDPPMYDPKGSPNNDYDSS